MARHPKPAGQESLLDLLTKQSDDESSASEIPIVQPKTPEPQAPTPPPQRTAPATLEDPDRYVRPRKPQWRYFSAGMTDPMPLSRSKLELFFECPRCFYLDRKSRVKRPSWPKFTLNEATDILLKKEFDGHRRRGTVHPLLAQHGLDLVPFSHPDLETWRDNFTGLQHYHAATNFLVFGAVDDIWLTRDGQLVVVDYKSTRTDKEISLEDRYKQGYKRQMDVYHWILAQNGWPLANRTYFLFANGQITPEAFDARLEFEMSLVPYEPNPGWVDRALAKARHCLGQEAVPETTESCEYCTYWRTIGRVG